MFNNIRPESMVRITNETLAKAFIEEQIAEVRKQDRNCSRQHSHLHRVNRITALGLIIIQAASRSWGIKRQKAFPLTSLAASRAPISST